MKAITGMPVVVANMPHELLSLELKACAEKSMTLELGCQLGEAKILINLTLTVPWSMFIVAPPARVPTMHRVLVTRGAHRCPAAPVQDVVRS